MTSMGDWLAASREVIARPLPELGSRRLRFWTRALRLVCGPFLEPLSPEDRRRLAALPEPAIFAFNHNNTFECLAVPAAMIFERRGRLIHFLIDWMYTELPVVGRVLKAAGAVPVFHKPARWRLKESTRRRGRAAGAPLGPALDRLRSGGSLGIFPEGRRNPSATTLLRGRQGLGLLVLLSDVPVVPVGIDFPARRRLRRVPRIGRLRLRIGEPLTFADERRAFRDCLARPQDPGRLKRRSRQAAREVVDTVMERLAELSGKACPGSGDAASPDLPGPEAPAPLRAAPSSVPASLGGAPGRP